MIEAQRGPGRPPIDEESRKTPFSASIRKPQAERFERIVSIIGAPRGHVLEDLINEKWLKVADDAFKGRAALEEYIAGLNLGPVVVEYGGIQIGEQYGAIITTGPYKFWVTERAMYAIAGNDAPFLTNPQIDAGIAAMVKLHTTEAHLDVVNGKLSLGTPQSVNHALEILKNKYVRMWIIGDNEPYVGMLTDFGEGVALGPMMGGPPTRNGTGLIHKGNVLRVEPLEL